ncbi:hypothetical protein [Rhodanobacter sp. MP1X3]|jgi:hypothetical protein|uniref:hypothetical protein n=1 Tax=Rhodanobacter sp. MP1X3 TaxID=2723086 RepID=UPI00161D6884|nr:hypothetical protein [Rhodanobacter sp. MP1X3]
MIPASRKNIRKVQARLDIVQSPTMSSQSLPIVPHRQPAMAMQKSHRRRVPWEKNIRRQW